MAQKCLSRFVAVPSGGLYDRPTVLKVWDCNGFIVRREYLDGISVPPSAGSGRTPGSLGESRSDSSARRSKFNVQCLLLANARAAASGWFWTGTFADDVTDYGKAASAWSDFVRRLRADNPDLAYVCVPEIQEKRKAVYGVAVWHFHAVIWNLKISHVSEIGEMWNKANGGTHNRDRSDKVKSMDKISSYIRKYVTKNTLAAVPPSRRSFFSSKNLVRPVVDVWRVGDDVPPLPLEITPSSAYSYFTEHQGRISQYQIKV